MAKKVLFETQICQQFFGYIFQKDIILSTKDLNLDKKKPIKTIPNDFGNEYKVYQSGKVNMKITKKLTFSLF